MEDREWRGRRWLRKCSRAERPRDWGMFVYNGRHNGVCRHRGGKGSQSIKEMIGILNT